MSGLLVNKYLPDISNKTIGLYSLNSASTTYVDVCNISGSGYLLDIAQTKTGSALVVIGLKIVLDGITIVDQTTSLGYGGSLSNLFFMRFKTSLVVQAKIASDSFTTRVTVALD